MNAKAAWILIFLLIPWASLRAQDAFEVPKTKVTKVIDGTEYYIHTVQKGQTVYKISKTYNIAPEELIRLNPEIADGLKPDQELKIPTGKKESKKGSKEAPVSQPAAVQPVESPPPLPKPCGTDPSVKKSVYDVALMMHFFLGDVDTIDVANLPDDPAAVYRPFQFIQFYEGFLMAVDSLKKSGLSVRLHVYDVSTDTVKTKKFLEDPELKKMDLMIGLMYHRNFQIVADFAKANRIPIVSPVSDRESQVVQNPYVIKVRPSSKTLVPQVADMIVSQHPDANIIIVRNAQSRFREQADQLQRYCSAGKVNAVVTEGNTMTDYLKQDALNIVAIFSENKSSILDLLTQLNAIKNQYQVAVFGLPGWDRIDGLEVDYLVSLKTHIASAYFIDYDKEDVKKFVNLFQQSIRTDPDPLAFFGFDVANYFLTALMKYGTAFPGCLRELDLPLLEAKYEFERTDPAGGYENQHWMIYYYENFRVYGSNNE